ncbi:MAG: 5-formyltetrahydrofolate cyclo-ligase [Actinobacteria bacterium]|nr:5-formyltetrahydrofolate cyclo-ligase [Actinomycetota bacterium]
MEKKLDKSEEKKQIRQAIQEKRNSMEKETRLAFSEEIANKFLALQQYRDTRSILIFYPFRSEADSTFIIKRALKEGKKIILPKVKGKELELYYINDTGSQLEKSRMGIMEPVDNLCSKAAVEDVDIAVIPGLCFDKNMNRLGFGGGFFDRLIPMLPANIKKIAICFDLQVLDNIPVEKHDKKIDMIITEKSIYSKKIAILIAAYNEEKYIEDVIKNCSAAGLDIIIVDDGSTDKTLETVLSAKEKIKKFEAKIYILNHEYNMGKGQALKTGFAFALENGYFGVITLDADGQHDAGEIANFLDKISKEDIDIIVGSRFKDTKGMPFIRLATNVFTSWLISSIAGKKIDDVQSGYRYIGNRVLKNIKLETGNFDTEPEILLKASWMDYKIINIPISTIYHKDFVSHVNPVKDTIKFFRMVIKSIFWKIKFKRTGTTS